MSNTQSKEIVSVSESKSEFCSDFCSDKLVLKLDEVSSDSMILRTCYVVYDHTEGEYFVCGVNVEIGNSNEDFKFYCKTRKHVVAFLKYLLSAEDATINHVLYNYKYLDECEYVDYWMLSEQCDPNCELSGYNGADFSKSWLSPLLKTLKHVRY